MIHKIAAHPWVEIINISDFLILKIHDYDDCTIRFQKAQLSLKLPQKIREKRRKNHPALEPRFCIHRALEPCGSRLTQTKFTKSNL